MSRGPRYPIGALSAQTGVNIETIRYYERVGLMPRPARTAGGRRIFDEGHVKRLTFIRRGRELGFSLEEVRALLGLAKGDGQGLTCAEVKAITDEHIQAIKAKVADLKRLERVLTKLAAQCHGTRAPDCPILDALARARPR